MSRRRHPRTARRALLLAASVTGATLMGVPLATSASATPVCTDGFRGGPPRALCGGRIFPEAENAQAYVQHTADPLGFREYADGIDYLAQLYPRWISVTTLSEELLDPSALSAAGDRTRSTDPADSGDGREIQVIKITDHSIPDEGKKTLAFSLAVHGNERGGLEGGLRAAEDLAMAATSGGTIVDGVEGYESTTGKEPVIHSYEVADVLAREAVYLVDFNPDGWAVGDLHARPAPSVYGRTNGMGTDLNRQMPSVGRINPSRNPLQEVEASAGVQWMKKVAGEGEDGLLAFGGDIHGELTSRAYVDIMYPAGQFDSVEHRRLMAIAERTKSVIDATLYEGILDEIENNTGGDSGEGLEAIGCHLGPETCVTFASNTIPNKPAHWATVWDTLGYTDTGFIGDYMATDLAVTGMDYEIALNHTVPDKVWNVYLQENHINASRAIIKTAMAYALTQTEEFNDDNVVLDTVGQAGYVINPVRVTDTDADGPGTLPGPAKDGIGADGQPVEQASYSVTNQQWFQDTSRLMTRPFVGVDSADVAGDPAALLGLDTLVLADVAVPLDADGDEVDATAYWAAIGAWVRDGGNLVLTDRALHGLVDLGLTEAGSTSDISVYQPYSDITDFGSPLVEGLRPNARQLVEAAILGYGIGSTASPMTVVDEDAFTGAGGQVVGTTGTGRVSLGILPVGEGQVQVVGGALPTPTEVNDHRFGLRSYGLTYSGLYVMENAITYSNGAVPPPVVPEAPVALLLPLVALGLAAAAVARRRRAA